MKKLFTILTISFTLLLSSVALASTNHYQTTNQIILHGNTCNYDQYSNLYISEVMTENEEVYVIESYDDISGEWLNATINKDYEIIDYTILKQ